MTIRASDQASSVLNFLVSVSSWTNVLVQIGKNNNTSAPFLYHLIAMTPHPNGQLGLVGIDPADSDHMKFSEDADE